MTVAANEAPNEALGEAAVGKAADKAVGKALNPLSALFCRGGWPRSPWLVFGLFRTV